MQKEPKFVYTVNMDVDKLLRMVPHTLDFISELEPKIGLIEHLAYRRDPGDFGDLVSIVQNCRKNDKTSGLTKGGGPSNRNGGSLIYPCTRKPKVAVVGSGPSGLFASLVLAEFGADVSLIERGQAVEQRGHDIGALVVRRMLQEESNFCFGEVISLFT